MALLAQIGDLDVGALLALNNDHARELSAMDRVAFDRHISIAFFAKGSAAPAAFLLAFDETASDLGPNFRWFQARYERFVYIDRVVVAAAGRGHGLASLLYRDLFEAATKAGHTMVGCEVNIDPPNRPSDAFHARLGFIEVGQARLEDRGKTVRYLTLNLAPDAAVRAINGGSCAARRT